MFSAGAAQDVNATRPPGCNTRRFGESPVWFGNMVNSEIRYNRVERFISERQGLRICFLEADPGMVGTRRCDHRRGKIESHRQCSTLRRFARYKTRSAGKVKYAHSCSDASGVEQIVDKAPRRVGKGCGVVCSRPLPAGMLKITDSLRIEGHHSAAAEPATRSARSRWHCSARASTPGEDLVRAGQVELRHVRKDQHPASEARLTHRLSPRGRHTCLSVEWHIGKLEETTMPLLLACPAIPPGGDIRTQYTCDGAGISPPLTWSALQDGIKSLVLVVENWGAFDIPAGSRGRQPITGDRRYHGPC